MSYVRFNDFLSLPFLFFIVFAISHIVIPHKNSYIEYKIEHNQDEIIERINNHDIIVISQKINFVNHKHHISECSNPEDVYYINQFFLRTHFQSGYLLKVCEQ